MSTVLKRFEAVMFDGDGTLWNFDEAMRQALEESAREFAMLGLSSPNGAVSATWLKAVRDEVAKRPAMDRQSMEVIRLAAFRESVAQCGADPARMDEFSSQLYEKYMDARFTLLKLYADVSEGLSSLRGLARLALVTNGNTSPSRVGLDRTFDAVVVSAECKLFKPDPAIYHYAARQLGLDPSACVHVGDHPIEDVQAARAAGMTAVWMNREESAWSSDYGTQPITVVSMAGLAGVLRANGCLLPLHL